MTKKMLLLALVTVAHLTQAAPITFSAAGANYYVQLNPGKSISMPYTPELENKVSILRFVVQSAEYANAVKNNLLTDSSFTGINIIDSGNNTWSVQILYNDPHAAPFSLVAIVNQNDDGSFQNPKFLDLIKPVH